MSKEMGLSVKKIIKIVVNLELVMQVDHKDTLGYNKRETNRYEHVFSMNLKYQLMMLLRL